MYLCNIKGRIDDLFRTFGEIVEHSLAVLAEAAGVDHFAVNENFSILFADEIFRMHPQAKIVLTVRNPLDVYSDSRRVGWLAMPYDIQQFIKWQNHMCYQVRKLYAQFPAKILVQSFEDLILDYDQSLEKLTGFLGMDLTAHRQRTIFKPEISAKNMGQWKNRDQWLGNYQDQFAMLQNPRWWQSNELQTT